jgi:hypothetical protein
MKALQPDPLQKANSGTRMEEVQREEMGSGTQILRVMDFVRQKLTGDLTQAGRGYRQSSERQALWKI